jgi:hydrogenase maturation protein HypF
VLLRRARGSVPRPLRLRQARPRAVLACGAALKNTFCFAVGDEAYLGPHIGDLESLDTCRAFESAIERMQRFLGVRSRSSPTICIPTTCRRGTRSPVRKPCKIGVQHHHAHVASAMAEHGLQGSGLGVAYDGTGYGPDGVAWGAEVLLASARGFERVATFRAIPLPAGTPPSASPGASRWRWPTTPSTARHRSTLRSSGSPAFAGSRRSAA